MSRKLRCPDDTAPMQPLYLAPSRGGVQVEIDRCLKCGALWFDAGELELLAGLDSRDTHAEAKRDCPNCHEPLADAMLAANTVGQRCDRCHGTFVDGQNMQKLKALSLPSLVKTDKNPPVERRTKPVAQQGPIPTVTPARAKQPKLSGFDCARCGKNFPFSQGNGTNKGLMCPTCVVNPTIDPKGSRGGLLGGATEVFDDDGSPFDWDFSDLF